VRLGTASHSKLLQHEQGWSVQTNSRREEYPNGMTSAPTQTANRQTKSEVDGGRPTADVAPLRVLHCIPTLGGGGAERQVAYLSEQMTRIGASVHIACLRRGPNFERVQKSGVILHELMCRNNYDPWILWQLVQMMHKVRPDLVQTWLPQMDVLGGLAAILNGIPFMMSERSCSKAYIGTWKDRLRLIVGRRAVAIIANSESGKRYWQSLSHSRTIKVIRNGIPFSEIQRSCRAADEVTGVGAPTEVILWAGRYSAEKNPLMLLKAVRQVLTERVNAVVILFGEGPLKDDLIAMANQYGLQGRIRIEDFNPQLWSWMKRANLFVSTSLFEGSPNAVLEAAAAGCPIVLSDIPEHRELLHDDSAFFVSPSDPTAVAQGMITSLRDPEKAERKAGLAYEELSRWSVESVAAEYIRLYSAALAST
jgi:glycosyltransferase involved in cell wall biosynthesis